MSRVPQPQDDRTTSFGNRVFARFSIGTQTYCVPIDEPEENRLGELHRILRELIDNRIVLTRTPFPPPNVDEPSVLDCGSGKAAWIDDLLEEYEDCEVTGVDIYFGDGNEDDDDEPDDSDGEGVQEYIKKRWNLNAPFPSDRSSSRLRQERFDLINSRFLAEGILSDRWPSYIRELKHMLKPGGWLQMAELEFVFQSDSGRLRHTTEEALHVWSESYRRLMRSNDKDPRIGRRLGQLMNEQGFEAVWSRAIPLQVGAWNTTSRSLGVDIRANLSRTLESVSLWPFVGHMQGQTPAMSVEQYRGLLQGARRQLQDDSLRLYYNVYVAVGRRPLGDGRRR